MRISSNRNFGLVFFFVFLIISLWPLLNEGPFRFWSIIIAIIFLILGLINSKLLTPLNILWFKFGIALGAIVAPIIMGIIFFAVLIGRGLWSVLEVAGRMVYYADVGYRLDSPNTVWLERTADPEGDVGTNETE